MSQNQAQEQVTKDPKDNDPFRTKYKATALGGEKKKKDDKLATSRAEEVINKWTQRAKLRERK